MKTSIAVMIAALLAPIAQSSETAAITPEAVLDNFILEVSALASNYTELAGFPAYVERLGARPCIDFKQQVMPFAVSFQTNITPVLTKRRIRPSDCGENGIFLQFILEDGAKERETREAPIDTVTYLPNLKRILYADMALWEKASPELKKKLEDIIARHKAMLQELDKKKTANQAPEDTARKLADPQH